MCRLHRLGERLPRRPAPRGDDKLISGAGSDGSFATGADGATRRPGGGSYFAAMTYAPPQVLPPGVRACQLGKLLTTGPGGGNAIVANITAFERNNDPDGEGFDSNPYSALALGKQVLVADAAGDSIVRVKRGRASLWAALPDPGPRVDPVPTSITRGGNGHVYVGTLWSERRGKARVLEYNRDGEPGLRRQTGRTRTGRPRPRPSRTAGA